MKKIILYTDTPQIGGAENQILLLASGLDRERFLPVLVCSSNPSLDQWCKKFTDEGVRVIRLEAKHKHNPKHYFELKKIIKSEKPSLIHAHVWNPASCRYAFLAAHKTKTPIISTEHDPFKLSRLKTVFKNFTMKECRKIITVSNNNRKLLSTLYPQFTNKISVIHNGVNISWWKAQLMGMRNEDYQKIKCEILQAKEDTFIVSTVAELHERKGIDILLEAIPAVVEKFSNVKFVFIGNGPQKEQFINLAHSLNLDAHVTFLGQRKHVARLLAISDLFVLPSRREAFGLVNVEAMLCGLPVVASKVGGIPEIILDGKCGSLVEPGDSKALSQAIIELISDPKKRKKFAENGYKRAHEKFDMKEMIAKYQELYQEF